jgi:hypothetical protein
METIVICPSNEVCGNDDRKKSNESGGDLNTESLREVSQHDKRVAVETRRVVGPSQKQAPGTKRWHTSKTLEEEFYLQIIEPQILDNNTAKSPKDSIRCNSRKDNRRIKPRQWVLEGFPHVTPFDVVVCNPGVIFADL